MDRPTSYDLREPGPRLDHSLPSDFHSDSNFFDNRLQQQRADLVQQTSNLVDAKTLPNVDLFDGDTIDDDSDTADNSDPSKPSATGRPESIERPGQPAERIPEDTASTAPRDGLVPTEESEFEKGNDTGTNQTPGAVNDNKEQPQNGTGGQDDGSGAVSSAQDTSGYASHDSTHQDEIELKTSAGPRPLDGIPPLFPRPGQQHPTDDSR